MRVILVLILGMLLMSCNSHRKTGRERITYVLAVNQMGDTIKVPLRELRRNMYPQHYSRWQFYWGDSWYWGNVWYPQYFVPYYYRYWNGLYWSRYPVMTNPSFQFQPQRQVIPQRTRIRTNTPRGANQNSLPPRGNSNRVSTPGRETSPRTTTGRERRGNRN